MSARPPRCSKWCRRLARSMKPPVLVQNTRSRSCQAAPAWIRSYSHCTRRRRRASITSGGTFSPTADREPARWATPRATPRCWSCLRRHLWPQPPGDPGQAVGAGRALRPGYPRDSQVLPQGAPAVFTTPPGRPPCAPGGGRPTPASAWRCARAGRPGLRWGRLSRRAATLQCDVARRA
jgi:hypothetical protein